MDTTLRIVIEALNKAHGELSQVQGDLADIEGAGKRGSGGLSAIYEGAKSQILPAIGIIAGFGAAVATAFDMAEEGAQILQTESSFATLLETVGAAPDLLKQLQAASGDTVDDLSLMSNTTALLSGTSGQLATALATATPELLEIARAANKVNPALGDVNFMYNSLALGIKRASPMILDNLGLTIKVGEANATYAESVGKSVDELTAEEQKIALLNATLDAGNTLIQQAGGNTDSMGDAFARAGAAIKNAADSLKTQLTPILSDTANGVYQVLTFTDNVTEAFTTHEAEVRKTSGSYSDYLQEMLRVTDVSGRSDEVLGNVAQQLAAQGKSAEEIGLIMGDYAAMVQAAADNNLVFNGVLSAIEWQAIQDGQAAATQGYRDVGTAADTAAGAVKDLNTATADSVDPALTWNDALMKDVAALQGMNEQAFVSMMVRQLSDAQAAGTITAQQMSEAQLALYTSSGLLSEEEKAAFGATQTLIGAYGSGKVDAEGFATAIMGIKGAIDQVPTEKKVTISVNYDVQEPPNYIPGPHEPPRASATGADFWAYGPTPMLVGEGGEPEHIQVTPRSETHNVTNNQLGGNTIVIQDATAAALLLGEERMRTIRRSL
jgi:hypothetical protein